MSEQIYVVDAELTFAGDVPPDRQQAARFAIRGLQTPSHLIPSLRWVTLSRALVGDLAVSASGVLGASQMARDILRKCVQRSTTWPLRSVSILSTKLGTL
jgi:hypothetical protein